MTREIPLYTLEGVTGAEVTTHYFSTEDGLGLSMLRFNREATTPATDSVMIVHGLTTSTDDPGRAPARPGPSGTRAICPSRGCRASGAGRGGLASVRGRWPTTRATTVRP